MLDTTRSTMMIRNPRELRQFVKSHDGASSHDLVEAINITLNLETLSNNRGHHYRLDAGRMLLECRHKVEAAGDDWWQWQKGKFDRSRRDIEKLMQLASAEDPEAAAEEERADARERMADAAKLRRNHPVEHILKLVRALTDDQRDELQTKLKGEWQW